MNRLHDFLDKATSSHIPTGVLVGVGIVLLLLAMKVVKGLMKFVFVVLALATVAGAVWWHFHKHG